MTRRSATMCALTSVALVSSAQLGMRWSMSRLPSPGQWLDLQDIGQVQSSAIAVICASITAYALSMLFWLLALRDLPSAVPIRSSVSAMHWFIRWLQLCHFSTRRSRYRKLWVSR